MRSCDTPEEVYITTTESISPTDEPVEETTEATTEPITEATTEATTEASTEAAAGRDPTDGCQRTYTICRRNDDQLCDDVIMTAINADGSHSVTDDTTLSTVVTTFTCGDDGLYSWKGITGITELTCEFVECG